MNYHSSRHHMRVDGLARRDKPTLNRELKKIKAEIVAANFDDNHEAAGGTKVLTEMINDTEPLSYIADHFGLSRERISQVIEVLLGESYASYLRGRGINYWGRPRRR